MELSKKRKMKSEKNDFDKMEFKENLPGQKAPKGFGVFYFS